MAVSLGAHLELDPQVSLRPERFGALAYHFGTRKLSFLKHPDLVAVVESLSGERTVEDALLAAGVDRAPLAQLPGRPGHPRDLGDDPCRLRPRPAGR